MFSSCLRSSPRLASVSLLPLLALACEPQPGSSTTGSGSTASPTSAPLQVVAPGPQLVDEEQLLEVAIQVLGGSGARVRIAIDGLPPGAHWDVTTSTVRFKPDFTQGGDSWVVVVSADDGSEAAEAVFPIEIRDTIQPPWPTVVSTTDRSDHQRLRLRQRTDEWLDSPGHAGREFEARVVIPKAASATNKLPVRVFLHGLGGSPYTGGNGAQFRIYPHDPNTSYWYGYASSLPGSSPGSGDTAPAYTERRILHLLEWVLRNNPGADPERVYVAGSSMGGAGAATLGLLNARHFCYVESRLGQTVARNHRPSRLTQLQRVWGDMALNLDAGAGMGAWDRNDLARALRDDPGARNQFVHTKHGKDDSTINFGAVAQDSTITGLSFLESLQALRVGHLVVWDEGGHGSADPVMGSSWWGSWNPIFDDETFLRRDLPFPAFSDSSLDDDPGTGAGNGNQPWRESAGYSGSVSAAGDTGWDGDPAGVRNRHLRWLSTDIIDEPTRLEMPLRVGSGSGSAPPRAGYPAKGDRLEGSLPAVVDVTPRRTQRFRPAPHEPVRWTFGSLSGTVAADSDGEVTIPRLPLEEAWTTLILER